MNKVANAIKEIISSVRGEEVEETGLDMNASAAAVKSAYKKRTRPLVVWLIAVLVLGIAWFVDRNVRNERPQGNVLDKSVAVLPFANMSSDPEQDYFSNGLTEDIITQLAKIQSLKVISRTSVMQYKTFPKPVKEVGREMGVAYVLVGSVQRSGDQVRISAQLIQAAT
jgi:TolB-like protein